MSPRQRSGASAHDRHQRGQRYLALLCDLALKAPLPAAAGIGVVAGLAMLMLSLRYEHRRLTPVVLSSYVATAATDGSPGVT